MDIVPTAPEPDKSVQEMTDREIAEETLLLLRAGRDAVLAALENPMLGGMMGAPSGDPFAAAAAARRG